jgi:hypothetical protein
MFLILFLIFGWASNADLPEVHWIIIMIPSAIVGPFLVTKFYMCKYWCWPLLGIGELFFVYVLASALVLVFGILSATILSELFIDISRFDSRSRNMVGGLIILSLLGWIFYPSKGWEKCLENEKQWIEAYFPKPREIEKNEEIKSQNNSVRSSEPNPIQKDTTPDPASTRSESLNLSREVNHNDKQSGNLPPRLYNSIICDFKFKSTQLNKSSGEILNLFHENSEIYFREVVLRLTSYRRAFCHGDAKIYLEDCNKVLLPFYITIGSEACRRTGIPSSYAAQILLEYFLHNCKRFYEYDEYKNHKPIIDSLLFATEGMLSMAPSVKNEDFSMDYLRKEISQIALQVISNVKST